MFVVAVVAICACLAASAIFTFTTLLRLRSQYISDRGREIAAALDAQARGPGRRNNPLFWQSLLEDNWEVYGDSVAYLAVVDQTGKELARAGSAAGGLEDSREIHLIEMPIGPGRGPHTGAGPQTGGWRLRVGLNESGAAFIRRQAFVHLGVSGLAVAALILISIYLLRIIRRFLELEARERAEQHLKSLGTMSAALAHEIRNPLGAMKGLTQLAQEELPPDHGSQPAMRTVVSEAERLEKLVSDLLDFARPKTPEIREFNVVALISDTAAMLRQSVEQKELSLETPSAFDLRIHSDPDGLRQVLLNIVSNALEAAPRLGTVSIHARKDDRDGGIVVEVEDSGDGIGDRDPEELFQPFFTTKTRGTGLGLAVSRQILEALGGSIGLANVPGKGARCTVRLPDRG